METWKVAMISVLCTLVVVMVCALCNCCLVDIHDKYTERVKRYDMAAHRVDLMWDKYLAEK